MRTRSSAKYRCDINRKTWVMTPADMDKQAVIDALSEALKSVLRIDKFEKQREPSSSLGRVAQR